MAVFVAWTSEPVDEPVPGPWQELRVAAPGLLLVESDQTLSTVYHELKWSLPEGTALVVVPVGGLPKLKGLAPGTTTWLRERVPRTD